MKTVISEKKTVACGNPQSPFLYFAWPTIARLENGSLALAASGFRLQHVCPFGKGVLSVSEDEGKSWTAPAVIIDTPLDDRDSGITPFGNGRAIFTSFNNTTDMQRAENKPRHLSEDPVMRAKARLIDAYLDYAEASGDPNAYYGSTYCLSEDGGKTFGALQKSPVTAPHGPIRMNDGSLLYVGRRFEAAVPQLECLRMAADGNEFEHLSYIPDIDDEEGIEFHEPHAVQLPDGTIIVHIRVQGSRLHHYFTVFQSISTDGGKTFSKPRQLLADRGGSPAHLLLHSSGTLISAYGYREVPYGIRLMFSRDGGQTWDTDYVLDCECGDPDLGYPATVELKDGSLLTVYYENVGGHSRIMQKRWFLPEAFR